jgi:hypothetical protein
MVLSPSAEESEQNPGICKDLSTLAKINDEYFLGKM